MNKAQITKDTAKKQIIIQRAFEAPCEKVWQAWTTPEILDQWWAPKPWKAVTKSFDFSPGGHWHYAMQGPAGEEIFAWVDYLLIDPKKSFTGEDAFCDAVGKKSGDMPSMHWNNEFQASGAITTITVTVTFWSDTDMQKIIEMGFEQGFSMGLDNLDVLLTSQK